MDSLASCQPPVVRGNYFYAPNRRALPDFCRQKRRPASTPYGGADYITYAVYCSTYLCLIIPCSIARPSQHKAPCLPATAAPVRHAMHAWEAITAVNCNNSIMPRLPSSCQCQRRRPCLDKLILRRRLVFSLSSSALAHRSRAQTRPKSETSSSVVRERFPKLGKMDPDTPINPVFKVPSTARPSHEAQPQSKPHKPRQRSSAEKESAPPSNTLLFLAGFILILFGVLLAQLFPRPPFASPSSSLLDTASPETAPPITIYHRSAPSSPRTASQDVDRADVRPSAPSSHASSASGHCMCQPRLTRTILGLLLLSLTVSR